MLHCVIKTELSFHPLTSSSTINREALVPSATPQQAWRVVSPEAPTKEPMARCNRYRTTQICTSSSNPSPSYITIKRYHFISLVAVWTHSTVEMIKFNRMDSMSTLGILGWVAWIIRITKISSLEIIILASSWEAIVKHPKFTSLQKSSNLLLRFLQISCSQVTNVPTLLNPWITFLRVQNELEQSIQTPMARAALFLRDSIWPMQLLELSQQFIWVKLALCQKHTAMGSVSILRTKVDRAAISTSIRTVCMAMRMSSLKLQARISFMHWAPQTDSVQATAQTPTTRWWVKAFQLLWLIQIDPPSKKQGIGSMQRRRNSCMMRQSKWKFWTISFAMTVLSSKLKSRSLKMN